MMIKALSIVLLALFSIASFAQKPVVTSIDRNSAGVNELVTLQGNNFGTNSANISISFGATKGTVTSISDQFLEAKLPAGATYDKISVTHLPSGLTGFTKDQFLPSFGGEHGFSASKFEGQKDFNSEPGLYDLCACDFDGDKKVDIATANDNANAVNVFANTTSNPGLPTISYNKVSVSLGTRSLHATCGDLNGDAKPDLVISEAGPTGDRIFIFKNTSNAPGNFSFTQQSVKLTGKKVKRVKITDLDLDGKPEIVITNQSANNVTILVNQSSTSTISFLPTPITLLVPGAASTDGLSVEDMNGDHRPDIITSQFLTATSNIFILPNTSTIGNISFADATKLTISSTIVNLRVGDLDQDGKPDIAATQLLASGITLFRNQSTGQGLTFGPPFSITTEERPWGIDMGDLDGDGKIDIVVASLTQKALTLLNNESTPGNFSFQTTLKATTFINRHVAIADADGDGKPDIAFTSIDDNNNGIPASKISIFRNTICLTPLISPAGPHVICAGFPLRLSSNTSSGLTYQWKKGTTIVSSGPNPFFDITASGDYTVTAMGEAGSCNMSSNAVSVTVQAGTTTGPATATNNGPICIGSTLNLGVNDVGGTQYKWTGPNGYSSSGLNPSSIPNFQAINAGRYQVEIFAGSCKAQEVATVVEAIAVPAFQVSAAGGAIVCPPSTKTLSISPNLGTFSYQWFNASGPIAGGTGPSYNAASGGDYYAEAQYTANPGCATVQTQPVKVSFVSAPVPNFNMPQTVCTSQNVNFVNQTTFDTSTPVFYNWDFGNGNVSADENPTSKYLSAATFPVTLTASYANGACAGSIMKNIVVQAAPAFAITNPNNKYIFCPGDSLKLEVAGSFTSFLWNTGQTTSSIFVKEARTYSVEVTSGSCVLSDDQQIEMFPAPVVTITASPARLQEGERAQLNASGLVTYQWQPAETLSNAFIQDPVATPLRTTTYTVSGSDVNGCAAEKTIEVFVNEGNATEKLKPSPFFSPNNGDDIGKYWIVERAEEFDCHISVFDEKGIKVFDALRYESNWDGTYNGQNLPDGVYYYIIRCQGEENKPKRGTITILR